jgi:hypothetical protein
MTEVAVRENLPARETLFSNNGKLSDLMWITQMEMGGYSLRVRGIIKPDLNLKTVPELRKQLTDSYHEIVTILEEAEAPFWSYPELDLKGKVFRGGVSCGVPPQVYNMEATIRIELELPR